MPLSERYQINWRYVPGYVVPWPGWHPRGTAGPRYCLRVLGYEGAAVHQGCARLSLHTEMTAWYGQSGLLMSSDSRPHTTHAAEAAAHNAGIATHNTPACARA